MVVETKKFGDSHVCWKDDGFCCVIFLRGCMLIIGHIAVGDVIMLKLKLLVLDEFT